MTEQIVEGVVSAEVDTESRRIVHKGTLGAETAPVPSMPANVKWHKRGQVRLISEDHKSLTERLDDAYRDDELEPEEREFLDLTREHFSRLNDE